MSSRPEALTDHQSFGRLHHPKSGIRQFVRSDDDHRRQHGNEVSRSRHSSSETAQLPFFTLRRERPGRTRTDAKIYGPLERRQHRPGVVRDSR